MYEILRSYGLSDNNIEMFLAYFNLLIDWNERINLTSIVAKYEVATKHFLDSIAIFESGIIEDGISVIDVGTGAGFPGIPMKIIDGSLKITLLDSLNKRVNFLNAVIENLNLKDINALHSRAEDAAHDKSHRGRYDVCVSRAVANLSTLSELCLPFVKTGGYFISMKGPSAIEEVKTAKNALKLLGAEILEVKEYQIPTTDLKHCLVIIKKISDTSIKYPRKAPKPMRNPL